MSDSEVFTIKQIIRYENRYIKKYSFGKLINKASSKISDFIDQDFSNKKLLFVCGPGNNGLDGELACKKLKRKNVRLLKINKKGDIDFSLLKSLIYEVDVIFDCIFGTGLNKKLNKNFTEVVNILNNSNKKIVSVDIPTGINGDTGEVMGKSVKADITLCMHFLKIGYFLLPGKKFIGKIIQLKLGLTSSKKRIPKINLIKKKFFKKQIPNFDVGINKYNKGHVLVIGGEMPGASRLVAYSSRKSGAGLSTIAVDKKFINLYSDSEPGTIIKKYEESDLDNKDALVIGPGLGKKFSKKKIIKILEIFNGPIIIDADAISVFEYKKNEFKDFLKNKKNILLTPHVGEFKRIFNYVFDSKILNCVEASNSIENHVLFKGHDSVISFFNDDIWINSLKNNNLATAGSGDILCGLVAGLIAQKMNFKSAVIAGVWVQNEISKSRNNVVVEDFLKKIPYIINSLKNNN